MKIQTLPEELSIDSLSDYPRRIVCLTDETTETLYLLGEDARIAGVSGYTVRPKEVRSKPRVSAFVSAKIDKIMELRPDLVLAFSDLQADIVLGVNPKRADRSHLQSEKRRRDLADDSDLG